MHMLKPQSSSHTIELEKLSDPLPTSSPESLTPSHHAYNHYEEQKQPQQPTTTLKQKQHEQDTHEVPDSGIRAWSVIFGCCFVSFSTFGMINSYAAFQTYYETTLFPETASWKLSIIGASQASGVYFITPLAIPLHHALGIRNVLALGGVFMVITFMGLSSMKIDPITQQGELWKCYLFQAVMFPIGAGLLFPPVMLSPIEWFKRNRAFALGVAQSGVGLGGTVWPIVFKYVSAEKGYNWGVRTIGFIYIPLMIGAATFIPRQLESKYLTTGQKPLSNSKFNLANLKVLHFTYLKMFKKWGIVARNTKYFLLLVANLIGMFGSYPAIFYIDYYAHTIFRLKSPGSELVKWILVLFNIMGMPGRIIPAFIADKVGRLNVIITVILLSGIFLLTFWLSSIENQLISLFVVFVLAFGFVIGPFFSLFPACLSQVFGSIDGDSRIGFFLFISTPGPILGSVISGRFIKKDQVDIEILLNSFKKLCYYSGFMMIASGLVILLVRLLITRKIFKFV